MLIRNKSSTVVDVILCLGKVASPLQGGGISAKRDGNAATVACRVLLRWYAFVGIATWPGVLFEGCRRNRWIHSDETKYRRNRERGRKTRAEPVAKHREKNNVAESGRKRQKRGGKKRRVKIERDREFGKVHVFLNAVCANVTAFKVEYIARMYFRYTRSGLRLTRVTYIFANYIKPPDALFLCLVLSLSLSLFL